MTWPIPAPGAIAERYAAGFEDAFALDPDTGLPRAQTVDARSPNTALRALGVVGEETFTELYLYQSSLATELMIDTAQDWLARHGAEWGVPQLQPLTALGTLIFSGPAGTVLPQGIEVYLGTLRWQTSVAATIPASGAISIPSEAEIAGTASNLAGGTVLPLVSPVAGITPQSAVLDPAGFVGGRDLEDVEAWRTRILQRVRQRGQSGSDTDYKGWAIDAGAGAVQVLPQWIGPGTVGVAVLMPGPRVPTSPELARIDASIQQLRPVTATTVTLAGSLAPIDMSLALSPDTVSTRAAVLASIAAFLAREATIGGTLPHSRLDDAISSASGEYDHLLAVPAGDIVPAPTALPTLGVVTFTSGAALPQAPI
jgi:uncharacterized phage protein gp47/JayE